MKLRILIIEDEILIAEAVRLFLEEQGHEVVGICISYHEAVAAFLDHRPDMAILDIRLYGEKSGIDFAEFLLQQSPTIPFIYLTSQHDRRTFDYALNTVPYGYLSKPIRKESLWVTVETAYQLFLNGASKNRVVSLFDGEKNHRLNEDDILYIKSEHVYVRIYLADNRQVVVRKPLYQVLKELNSKVMFQCHRSYAVNINKISIYNDNQINLSNGENIPLSRSRKESLKAML